MADNGDLVLRIAALENSLLLLISLVGARLKPARMDAEKWGDLLLEIYEPIKDQLQATNSGD